MHVNANLTILLIMQRLQQERPYTALLSVYSLLALHRLLSDAEIAEDVIQDVLRVNARL